MQNRAKSGNLLYSESKKKKKDTVCLLQEEESLFKSVSGEPENLPIQDSSRVSDALEQFTMGSPESLKSDEFFV